MKKSFETVVSACKEKQALVKLTATTAVMTVGPAMCALAAESGAPAGESLLSGDVLTGVQTGIANVQATGIQVIGLLVVPALAVVGLSAAVNFVIKKVKGVLSKAG